MEPNDCNIIGPLQKQSIILGVLIRQLPAAIEESSDPNEAVVLCNISAQIWFDGFY